VRRVGSLILQMVPSDQLKITADLECDEVYLLDLLKIFKIVLKFSNFSSF
jgi:hypothetical protein